MSEGSWVTSGPLGEGAVKLGCLLWRLGGGFTTRIAQKMSCLTLCFQNSSGCQRCRLNICTAAVSVMARGTQDGVARSSVRVPRPTGSSLTSLRCMPHRPESASVAGVFGLLSPFAPTRQEVDVTGVDGVAKSRRRIGRSPVRGSAPVKARHLHSESLCQGKPRPCS